MSSGMNKIRKNKKGQTVNGHMGKNMRKAELVKELTEEQRAEKSNDMWFEGCLSS